MAQRSTVVVLRPAMSSADARAAADQVERLLLADRSVVLDVLGGDLGVVGVLARVRLVAQRLGACERVDVTGLDRVGDLLALCGLREVLREAEAPEQ